mmetsp:Transcript_68690/g.155387  ORF Transcript_68690/g.155387 Transcript_68690/m.155387 type:complete len:277 (-) Transcript_68690:20-850(-)
MGTGGGRPLWTCAAWIAAAGREMSKPVRHTGSEDAIEEAGSKRSWRPSSEVAWCVSGSSGRRRSSRSSATGVASLGSTQPKAHGAWCIATPGARACRARGWVWRSTGARTTRRTWAATRGPGARGAPTRRASGAAGVPTDSTRATPCIRWMMRPKRRFRKRPWQWRERWEGEALRRDSKKSTCPGLTGKCMKSISSGLPHRWASSARCWTRCATSTTSGCGSSTRPRGNSTKANFSTAPRGKSSSSNGGPTPRTNFTTRTNQTPKSPRPGFTSPLT